VTQLKEATAHRRHRIRQRLATGRGMARLPRKPKPRACPTWTPAPSTHARFATSRRWPRGGEQRNPEHSRTPLGRGAQGVGGPAVNRRGGGGHRPFGGAPPPPQPRLRESGGDAALPGTPPSPKSS
jgi:hypothetical protein